MPPRVPELVGPGQAWTSDPQAPRAFAPSVSGNCCVRCRVLRHRSWGICSHQGDSCLKHVVRLGSSAPREIQCRTGAGSTATATRQLREGRDRWKHRGWWKRRRAGEGEQLQQRLREKNLQDQCVWRRVTPEAFVGNEERCLK